MRKRTKRIVRIAAISLATTMAGLGFLGVSATEANAAKWLITGKVYSSAIACDNAGRYYVYEFKKKVGTPGNEEYIGYSAYDCNTLTDGEKRILSLYGFVKK